MASQRKKKPRDRRHRSNESYPYLHWFPCYNFFDAKEQMVQLCGGFFNEQDCILLDSTAERGGKVNPFFKTQKYYCRQVNNTIKCTWRCQLRQQHENGPVWMYVREETMVHSHDTTPYPTQLSSIYGIHPRFRHFMNDYLHRQIQLGRSLQLIRPKETVDAICNEVTFNHNGQYHEFLPYVCGVNKEHLTTQVTHLLKRRRKADLMELIGVSTISNTDHLDRVIQRFPLIIPESYQPRSDYRHPCFVAEALGLGNRGHQQMFLVDLSKGPEYAAFLDRIVVRSPAKVKEFEEKMQMSFMLFSPTGLFQVMNFVNRPMKERGLYQDAVKGVSSNCAVMVAGTNSLRKRPSGGFGESLKFFPFMYVHAGGERTYPYALALYVLRGISYKMFGKPFSIAWGNSDHANAIINAHSLFSCKPELLDDVMGIPVTNHDAPTQPEHATTEIGNQANSEPAELTNILLKDTKTLDEHATWIRHLPNYRRIPNTPTESGETSAASNTQNEPESTGTENTLIQPNTTEPTSASGDESGNNDIPESNEREEDMVPHDGTNVAAGYPDIENTPEEQQGTGHRTRQKKKKSNWKADFNNKQHEENQKNSQTRRQAVVNNHTDTSRAIASEEMTRMEPEEGGTKVFSMPERISNGMEEPEMAYVGCKADGTSQCWFHVMQFFINGKGFVGKFKNKSNIHLYKMHVQLIHQCRTEAQRKTVMKLVLLHWKYDCDEAEAAEHFRKMYCIPPYCNWNYACHDQPGLTPTNSPLENFNLHQIKSANAPMQNGADIASFIAVSAPARLTSDALHYCEDCPIEIPRELSPTAESVIMTAFMKESTDVVKKEGNDGNETWLTNTPRTIGIPLTEERIERRTQSLLGNWSPFVGENFAHTAFRMVYASTGICVVATHKPNDRVIGDCEECFKHHGESCPGVIYVRNMQGSLDRTLASRRLRFRKANGNLVSYSAKGMHKRRYLRGQIPTEKQKRDVAALESTTAEFLQSCPIGQLYRASSIMHLFNKTPIAEVKDSVLEVMQRFLDNTEDFRKQQAAQKELDREEAKKKTEDETHKSKEKKKESKKNKTKKNKRTKDPSTKDCPVDQVDNSEETERYKAEASGVL